MGLFLIRFFKNKKELEDRIVDTQKENELMMRKLNRVGSVNVQLRLGMLSIMEQLTEGKRKTVHK
jgi:hypothetical protein